MVEKGYRCGGASCLYLATMVVTLSWNAKELRKHQIKIRGQGLRTRCRDETGLASRGGTWMSDGETRLEA